MLNFSSKIFFHTTSPQLVYHNLMFKKDNAKIYSKNTNLNAEIVKYSRKLYNILITNKYSVLNQKF